MKVLYIFNSPKLRKQCTVVFVKSSSGNNLKELKFVTFTLKESEI